MRRMQRSTAWRGVPSVAVRGTLPVLAITVGMARNVPAAPAPDTRASVRTVVRMAPDSRDTLAGVVTDSAGRPAVGATVTLVEVGRTATVDARGRFAFGGLPPGRYTAVVRRLGYAAVVRNVIAGAAPLAIAIRPTSLRLEPVTVTATRDAVSPLASPLAMDALGGDRLRREHDVSLAHALDGLPGVRTLATGEQIGKPVIHGLTGPRVLVLDNGQRLEDYSWSDEDGPSVDARLAQRVEVIRGPLSVLYGSDAVAGVINTVTDDVPEARGREPFVRGGAEVYGASNNGEVGTVVRTDGAAGPLGFRAIGIRRRSGNFHTPPGNDSTPTGEIFNTGFRAVSGEAAFGAHAERGSATLRYARYGGAFGLLDGPPVPDDNANGPLRRVTDDRVQLAATRLLSPALLGGLRLETKSQWQRHALREVSGGSRTGDSTPTVDLLLATYTSDLLLHHGSGDAATAGVVGVSGLHQTNMSRGLAPLVPAARTAGAAGFVFETIRSGRWSVLVGIRGDVRRLDADSNALLALARQTRTSAALSGNVGAVYRLAEGLGIAANVGRGFRVPTLFELFTNGPRLGEARYEIGKPNARAEESVSTDVSLRWEAARVRVEVAGYRNWIDGYLYVAPTGEVRSSLPVYRYFQSRALLIGADLAAEFAALPTLTLRARADVVRGTNSETATPLPLVPPPRADVEAEMHTSGAPGMTRIYLTAGTGLVGVQTRLGPFDTPTAAYAVVRADGGVEWRTAGRPFALDLRIRNAANTRYQDFLSRYKSFAYAPGRNIVLRLSTGL